MMRRIAVMPVGWPESEFLPWAVEALDVACDEVHLFCPQHGMDVRELAGSRATNPVVWHDDELPMCHAFARKMDALVVVGAPHEIWDPSCLEIALTAVEDAHTAGTWLARMHIFAGGLGTTLVHDHRSARIFDPRHMAGRDAFLGDHMQPLPIYDLAWVRQMPPTLPGRTKPTDATTIAKVQWLLADHPLGKVELA